MKNFSKLFPIDRAQRSLIQLQRGLALKLKPQRGLLKVQSSQGIRAIVGCLLIKITQLGMLKTMVVGFVEAGLCQVVSCPVRASFSHRCKSQVKTHRLSTKPIKRSEVR